MKRTLMYLAVALLFVFTVAGSARADYSFSSCNPYLASSGETWSFNADGGAASTLGLNDWGSPGVGAGEVPYGESTAAIGFEIQFTGGGTIDPGQITVGDGAGCVGSTGGGTTMCADGSATPWTVVFNPSNPDTIEFFDPSGTLTNGTYYFVNVFFDGATPTGFTGEWITPEPGTLTLLGSGLLGLIGFARRRRS